MYNVPLVLYAKEKKEKKILMTDFDRIRNVIINYEDEKMTKEEALNEICKVCFERDIRIWDGDICVSWEDEYDRK